MAIQQKYNFVLFHEASGLEMTVSVRGNENREKVAKFLMGTERADSERDVDYASDNHRYIIDDAELAALRVILGKLS